MLTDFFLPDPKAAKNPSTCLTSLIQEVPGLSLHRDFVTQDEEANLLRFLRSEQCTWRTDLSRKTMHFGGEYCLMPSKQSVFWGEKDNDTRTVSPSASPQTMQAPPMPSQFDWLLQRMTQRGIYAGQIPQYCIVNHYTGNLGISAHTENFSFAQPVVGLSLLDSCFMRFHELVAPDDGSVRSGKAQKAHRTGKFIDVLLPGRSLVVMNDDARWKWQHEIVRSRKGRHVGWERVSLTFRVKT